MSDCQACAGMAQETNEPVVYSGRHRKWLCAHCRRVIDLPGPATAEDVEGCR